MPSPSKRPRSSVRAPYASTCTQPMLQSDEVTALAIDTLNLDLQCPICMNIIREPMATECLHRFCNNCIEKSLRFGKKECPSCRAYVATRRNLRRDENFARLIDSLYPDLDAFEEEEEQIMVETNATHTLAHQEKMGVEWQRRMDHMRAERARELAAERGRKRARNHPPTRNSVGGRGCAGGSVAGDCEAEGGSDPGVRQCRPRLFAGSAGFPFSQCHHHYHQQQHHHQQQQQQQ